VQSELFYTGAPPELCQKANERLRNKLQSRDQFLNAASALRVRNMMEILGPLVVIGAFVCWCDVTGAWNNVLRPIRAILPPYSK
jgi:hypothetical protein